MSITTTEFIGLARALVGLPYVLGAEWAPGDPSPRALDCSELVEGLYRLAGAPIGDLAASQFEKTVPVSPGGERVGDLVFLRNNRSRWNGIGHVAVLTAKLADGDWEIVEAKGRAHGVVRTTLSFWRTRPAYTGVRRFPPLALVPATTSAAVALSTAAAGHLAVDGVFGPATIRATQRWIGGTPDGLWGHRSRLALQRKLGVHADGIVGPRTVRALQRVVGARPDGQWGPATTRALQSHLNTLTNREAA